MAAVKRRAGASARPAPPQESESLHADALIAFSEGNLAAAIDLLEKVARRQPSDAGCIGDCGHVYWEMGLYEKAADAFERAGRLDPGFAEAHYNCGAALQQLGRGQQSVEAFKRAVLAKPALGVHKLRNAFGRWIGRRLPVLIADRAWAIPDRTGLAQQRLIRGRKLREAGDDDSGLREFRRALTLDPGMVPAMVAIGDVLRDRGNLPEAESCYRQAAAREPQAVEPIRSLGDLLRTRGSFPPAMACHRRALSLAPADAGLWQALAMTANLSGNPRAAADACRNAIATDPGQAGTWHQYGAALQGIDRIDDAIAALQEAVRLDDGLAKAHNDLGGLLGRQGRLEEAVASLRRAIAADPSLPLSHFNLANLLMTLGRHEEALTACRSAIDQDVNRAEAHFLSGQILGFLGRLEEAETAYAKTVEARPDHAPAHRGLGYVRGVRGDIELAFASFQQAIALEPKDPVARVGMGALLVMIGRIDEAIDCYRAAIDLDGNFADAHNKLGLAKLEKRRFDEAVGHFHRAIEIQPSSPGPHSNLLAIIPYLANHSAEDVAREHRRFGERLETPFIGRWGAHANDRDPDRVLRIGYLSSALRRNVQSQNMAPVLRLHDRSRVKVHVYAEIRNPDAVTERIKSTVESWTYIHGLTDDQAAERIRADGIDILIHTMGHFSDNRIMVCARKPAPIQVLYVCQSPTTGLRAFDYFIADRWLNAGGRLETLCTEKVVELPHGFQITEYEEAPAIAPPPVLARGHITFGSFNNPLKISAPCIALWSRVLRAVPDSRMLIKGRGLDIPEVVGEVQRDFARNGISAERLEFSAWLPGYDGHLGAHERIDIALDTLPFGGGRTTEDAIWMGVPVVTLIGDSVHGRLGYSHLNRIGLPELCARSPDEYVATAAGLAADAARLSDLRNSLRRRMKDSSIMDFSGHVGELEDTYRSMWARWCKGGGAAGGR